ncbi:MAG: Kelch repeat-containing protein [Promethearchaeota archaeon]
MSLRGLVVTLTTLALVIHAVPASDAQCLLPIVLAKPEARGAHSMVFDPYNEMVVVFGGTSMEGGLHSLGETLTYSYPSNQWARLTCTANPSARSNHAMVYCNSTNEIILYGGFGTTDTWSFSCETQIWSEIVTSTNPGVHHSLALAYDPLENVVILFGGFNETGRETDETWKFDLATREWSELTPAIAPLARYGHVMVYDESVKLIILTAGNTATQGHQDDTWAYNATDNTWTELIPTGKPDPLKWPSMTYDSANQKCILFGGQIGDNAVDRTWVYDALMNTWTRQYPDLSPQERINTGLAYDSVQNVTILFGGLSAGTTLDDTWSYSYESDTWTKMDLGSGSTTTISTTPYIPDGPGLTALTYYIVLSVGTISAVVVVVFLIKRRG